METLVIHIPDKKSTMVKQVLKDMGVSFQSSANENKRPSAHEFAGLISQDDLKLINAAIEEGCENIDPDGWK
jgi:hypothetical protein